MTLMLTMVGVWGIVHVTDSNLSDDFGPAGKGKKAFRCKRLRAGVTCAGAYSVNHTPMSEWLPARISEYETGASATIAGLADWLQRCLEAHMTVEEKEDCSFLHVAGYAWDGDAWHPDVYIVSNSPGLTEDGDYRPPEQAFQPLTEKFWSSLETDEQRAQFETGQALVTFINGFPHGRMAYQGLLRELRAFLEALWEQQGQRGWSFRGPTSLADCATYLRLHLSVVGHLFEMSGYGPIIGGRPQTVPIHPPAK